MPFLGKRHSSVFADPKTTDIRLAPRSRTSTAARRNANKATVAFVGTNAAVASDKQTLVFLSIERIRLSRKGYAEGGLIKGIVRTNRRRDGAGSARSRFV